MFLSCFINLINNVEASLLGATKLTCVYTAGGGAKNPTWTNIRARHLQIPIIPPLHTAAAFGTALLYHFSKIMQQ